MKYDAEKIKSFCERVMESAGVGHRDAALFSSCLVTADMRGMHSHGVTRLKTYYQRCRMGLVDPKGVPAIVRDTPSLLIVDGNNSLGTVSAAFAMEKCVFRAKENGVCFAAVRGGNHFGIAAYYAHIAAQNGMIGIACANGPVAIPAIGGAQPVLGTSPLAITVPSPEGLPIDLDMATSVVARGKIKLAQKEGKPIPEGWGIDANGRSTTDPNQVQYLLPFGGPKGFGIGLIIEILCSCLSGAKNAMTMGSLYDLSGTHQESGFFLGALNVGAVMDLDAFTSSVGELAAAIKASKRREGVSEILMPGELELRRHDQAAQEGIDIGPAVIEELEQLAKECGVTFDCEKK